jgi:hypothetical protein
MRDIGLNLYAVFFRDEDLNDTDYGLFYAESPNQAQRLFTRMYPYAEVTYVEERDTVV